MNKYSHFILGLLLILLLLLGGYQGRHLTHLREAKTFYEWVLSSATQMRVFGRLSGGIGELAPEETMDEVLYAEIEKIADEVLPDLPPPRNDAEARLSKLERYAITRQDVSLDQSAEEKIESAMDIEDVRQRHRELWKLAKSEAMADERQHFFQYLSEKKLLSAGTQMGLDMYSNPDAEVSLANMFFGFRKMAANLVWLQAESYWHEGQLYRMIPLTRTTVALDPNFIDAYLIGAWHLAYNATAPLPVTPEELKHYDERLKARVGPKERFYFEGIDFLLDGIRKNPTNYKLYFDLGYGIYEDKLSDHKNAIRHLEEAVRQQHDRWVPRMLFRSYMLDGRHDNAIAGWESYQKLFPDDPKPQYFIKINLTLKEEKELGELTTQFKALKQRIAEAPEGQDTASLTAEASELEARMDEMRDSVITKWTELAELMRVTNEIDPLAEAKLLSMQADELLAKGRTDDALGLLNKARWDNTSRFMDISDEMIAIKLQYDLPLMTTEKNWIREREKIAATKDRPIGGRLFQLRSDGWYQYEYDKQETQPLSPGDPKLDELRAAVEDLDEILTLNEIRDQYPEVAQVIDLGDCVVFKAGETWYRYSDGAA